MKYKTIITIILLRSHRIIIFNDIHSNVQSNIHYRAPKYFDAENIKRDTEDNWILRSNNVKKIVSTLDRLFQVELGIHYGTDIDVNKIARFA